MPMLVRVLSDRSEVNDHILMQHYPDQQAQKLNKDSHYLASCTALPPVESHIEGTLP